MPRALLLCEYPALNGGERSLLAVLPTLQQAGWLIDAWCPGAGPLAEAFTKLGVGVAAHRPIADAPTSLEERRADLASVIADSPQYALVHANSLSMGRLSGPVVEAAEMPSLAHLRDIVGLNRTAIADINRHTRLLAVSEAVLKHHVEQGFLADKCAVLHNGIDTELFKPAPRTGYLHREFGIEPSRRLVGIIGQLILRKSPETALTAITQLMQRLGDVNVVVVGARHSEKAETIELEKSLHELVAANGVADRVHFLGTRDDIPQLLPELSLLLHSAKQEPLGRVLLEAAACGVPIVATKVGGTSEIFTHPADGAILVPAGDAVGMRGAAELLLGDADFAADLSTAARNRITTAFSAERSAAGLLKHYAEVSGN